MQQITISNDFKRMTTKAIGSIALFIFAYILLVTLAIGLTILCGFLGFVLISIKITTITIMLAIGLVAMGILILIFLVKFIFKKHVTDLTHLTEISRNEEPMLFSFIEEIAEEVKTNSPKKVYLSSDVNASVFYDSSFWSMFLPVEKNLQIGIGLVNTVSIVEFKAIIAHEFGHFSQRSMKVGSFVYNVNQIIYNMLYENESFDSIAQSWANTSNYLAIFVSIATRLVMGIQWILKRIYNLVNLSYMSLSREMEFHADEVAAHVTGSRPLIDSLLRMELADHAYNEVLNYYIRKSEKAIQSQNLYTEQAFVMTFLAHKSKLPVKNNLPQVSLDHLGRYNKSKLVIANQWASHPSTEDRIHRLENLNLTDTKEDNRQASELFNNISKSQAQLTEKLFSKIQYSNPPVINKSDEFINEYSEEYNKNSFPDLYNAYYDNKNPPDIEFRGITQKPTDKELTLETLFSSKAVDDVYASIGLENDINTLRQIENGDINSFDYDGVKYAKENCSALILRLEDQLGEIRGVIQQNDMNIYAFFLYLAENQTTAEEYNCVYGEFLDVDRQVNDYFELYVKMLTNSNFIFETTPNATILKNLDLLRSTEIEFKERIGMLLKNDAFYAAISDEIRTNFLEYSSNSYAYFYDQNYKSEELDILFSSIKNYQIVLSVTHFNTKKHLLDYQAELVSR